MNKSLRKQRPFICKTSVALTALKYWLRERPEFNTVIDDLMSRSGEPAIGLGYEAPNHWERSGYIICADEAMREAAALLCDAEIDRRKLGEQAA